MERQLPVVVVLYRSDIYSVIDNTRYNSISFLRLGLIPIEMIQDVRN